MENFQFKQIKEKWLIDYFSFMQGRVTPREHGQNQVALLQEVITTYQKLQPYLTNLESFAENEWNKAKGKVEFAVKVERRKDMLINFSEPLKKSFLLTDLHFRQGLITLFDYNKFLSDFLVHLTASTGLLQPYFSELEKAAEEQWEKHQNNFCKQPNSKK